MKKICSLILFLIVIPATHVYAQDNIQSISSEGIPITTGVVLKINPSSISKPVGEVIEFTVSLNPGPFSIKALDLALTYNKDMFEVLNIFPTDLTKPMTEINKLIDGDTGSALYSLGVPVNDPDNALVKETGDIVTITAKTKKAGNTTLEINLDKTVIAAKNQDKNILFSAENATITGVGGDESPASEQATTAATTNSNLIPMIIAGVTFCVGLLIFVFIFLRKPKAE